MDNFLTPINTNNPTKTSSEKTSQNGFWKTVKIIGLIALFLLLAVGIVAIMVGIFVLLEIISAGTWKMFVGIPTIVVGGALALFTIISLVVLGVYTLFSIKNKISPKPSSGLADEWETEEQKKSYGQKYLRQMKTMYNTLCLWMGKAITNDEYYDKVYNLLNESWEKDLRDNPVTVDGKDYRKSKYPACQEYSAKLEDMLHKYEDKQVLKVLKIMGENKKPTGSYWNKFVNYVKGFGPKPIFLPVEETKNWIIEEGKRQNLFSPKPEMKSSVEEVNKNIKKQKEQSDDDKDKQLYEVGPDNEIKLTD